MYDLLAIAYDTAEAAEAARCTLVALAEQYLVDVADATVAGGDGQHRIQLQGLVDQWPTGPAWQPNWGTLASLLARHPMAGPSTSGRDALAAYGISDAFMEALARLIDPRGAVLLILTRAATAERVLDRLAHPAGRVLRCAVHRPDGKAGGLRKQPASGSVPA
ncbi:MAG: DUF1269 domain-containing protein [Rhodocyclaceae bacterium]|nr:DUF1269 domain-containing protein [Rhodocyclaceae bacterium]